MAQLERRQINCWAVMSVVRRCLTSNLWPLTSKNRVTVETGYSCVSVCVADIVSKVSHIPWPQNACHATNWINRRTTTPQDTSYPPLTASLSVCRSTRIVPARSTSVLIHCSNLSVNKAMICRGAVWKEMQRHDRSILSEQKWQTLRCTPARRPNHEIFSLSAFTVSLPSTFIVQTCTLYRKATSL